MSPEVLGEVYLHLEALPALSAGMGLLPSLRITLCAVLSLFSPIGLLSTSDGFLVMHLSSLVIITFLTAFSLYLLLVGFLVGCQDALVLKTVPTNHASVRLLPSVAEKILYLQELQRHHGWLFHHLVLQRWELGWCSLGEASLGVPLAIATSFPCLPGLLGRSDHGKVAALV